MQKMTDMRGTVNITGPRLCQNHDYARSKTEGIVLSSTPPGAYNFNCAPNMKQALLV